MPRDNKKQLAAKMQWATRRLASQATAAVLLAAPDPTTAAADESMDGSSEPSEVGLDLELPVEELLSTVEVNIKEEPRDEIEVEVELFNDPTHSIFSSEMPDPIGGGGGQDEEEEWKGKSQHQQQRRARCQFCLELYRVPVKGRPGIGRPKIEFVLGWREWGTPGMEPDCCKGCRKMFELFYEFKRSCLAALTRPAELLGEVEANESANRKMEDSKPKFRRKTKAEMMESNNGEPEQSNTEAVPEIKASGGGGLKDDSQAECLEEKAPIATDVKQDIKEPGFECQICLMKFSYGSALKKHWITHFFASPNTSSSNSAIQEGSTNPLIPEVQLDFPVPEQGLPTANAHSNVPVAEPDPSIAETTTTTDDEEPKKTYCGRCRKWFPSKVIYVHHKPFCIKYKERPPPAFACTLCPEKFRREEDLNLHVNKHNGIRTIPCRREGCTKMFFDTKQRCGHEQLCGKEAQMICSICGSRFKTAVCLRTHMDSHEEPKFSCDICQKSFHRKASLKKHAGAHSDERKFQCKVCGKRFKSHEANRVHQRIHTQETPYACHICGERFRYNCILKTHLEKGHDSVMGPNPFRGLEF